MANDESTQVLREIDEGLLSGMRDESCVGLKSVCDGIDPMSVSCLSYSSLLAHAVCFVIVFFLVQIH